MEDIDQIIQALQERTWPTSLKVEITKVSSPVENFEAERFSKPSSRPNSAILHDDISRVTLYVQGQRFEPGKLLETMIAEIEHDLNLLTTDYPDITNYRIGLYQIIYGNTVRFSKHYYK